MTRKLLAAALMALMTPTALIAHGAEQGERIAGSKDVKVTQVYEQALPGVPGKSLKGVIVDYGPGGYSPPHRHAKSAILDATVLEGSVRCQLNGGEVRTYSKGENWTELPGDHHGVSANASSTQAAKILAVFVVDDEDRVLTIPDGQ